MTDKNTGSYFWYAVGEILLVVIGIVIALQIDNWNDERVEQRQIREYLVNLVGGIERDFEMLEVIEHQIKQKVSTAESLDRYMQGKTVEQIGNIDLYTYVRTSVHRPYAWNRAAMEQIKNSGALRQIRNQKLVNRISQYDALTLHLDEDFNGDLSAMQRVEADVVRVVNGNYPNAQEISDFEDDLEQYDYRAFLKSDLYRQVKADDLSLLTIDINQVLSVTNYYSIVVNRMRPRPEREIPRLRGFGQEIIDMVKSEYQ